MRGEAWWHAAAIVRGFCLTFLAVVNAVLASPSQAGPITIEATGTVTSVMLQGGGLELYFPSVPQVGDSYTFRYTYEPTTADALPADPSQGIYTNALTALSLSVGSNPAFNFLTLPHPQNSIEIGNTGAGDYYNVLYAGASLTPSFGLNLISGLNIGGTAFTSDALPTSAPNIALFGGGGIGFPFFHFQTNQLAGGIVVSDVLTATVTSLSLVPVGQTMPLASAPLPIAALPPPNFVQPSSTCLVPTLGSDGAVCFTRVAASPYSTQACIPPAPQDDSALPCAVPDRKVTTPNGTLTRHQIGFELTKPTVVIAHGWRASAESSWVTLMANAIGNRANVFLWDWEEKAKSLPGRDSLCADLDQSNFLVSLACGTIPYTNVEPSGNDLAAALETALCQWDAGCWTSPRRAPMYTEAIHLIGHSLGTGVVVYAAKKIDASRYKENLDQLTLHDSCWFESAPGDTVLSHLKARSPKPVFVDNYVSLLPNVLWSLNSNNVNTTIFLPNYLLVNAVDCPSNQNYVVDAHGFANWWYTSSYRDFACRSLLGDLTVPAKPPQWGTHWGAERIKNRPDVAFLWASPLLFDKWFLSPISQLPAEAIGSVKYLGGAAKDLTRTAAQKLEEVSVKTGQAVAVLQIKAWNTATDATEWAADKANHAFWVVAEDLASGALRMILNSDVTVHAAIDIPAVANVMRFSFNFSEASPGTTLEVLLDGIPVYRTGAEVSLEQGIQVSDWIQIAPFSGRQVIMAFRLSNPVEGSRAVVTIDDLVIANAGPAGGPFASATASTLARQGSVVTLNGAGSFDPVPGPSDLSYTWAQLHGPFVQLDLTAPATPTFTPTRPGGYAFTLTVNDGVDTSLPSAVAIHVPELGDTNVDGTVDLKDLTLLTRALNGPASGPNDLRDLDGDGRITGTDVARLAKLLLRQEEDDD